MTVEELDKEIFEYLDRFLLRPDEIKHLIGICRTEEGKEFLFGKIKDALYSLEYLRFLIRKQFGCELCGQKPTKYNKVRKVMLEFPELSKHQIAQLVGCSVRHVERVIYNEL